VVGKKTPEKKRRLLVKSKVTKKRKILCICIKNLQQKKTKEKRMVRGPDRGTERNSTNGALASGCQDMNGSVPLIKKNRKRSRGGSELGERKRNNLTREKEKHQGA